MASGKSEGGARSRGSGWTPPQHPAIDKPMARTQAYIDTLRNKCFMMVLSHSVGTAMIDERPPVSRTASHWIQFSRHACSHVPKAMTGNQMRAKKGKLVCVSLRKDTNKRDIADRNSAISVNAKEQDRCLGMPIIALSLVPIEPSLRVKVGCVTYLVFPGQSQSVHTFFKR
jgi:hypothetical protein